MSIDHEARSDREAPAPSGGPDGPDGGAGAGTPRLPGAAVPGLDASEQWRALGRLALIVAAGVLAAVVTGTARTVAVVVAIVVMIMLHELGHFATAKLSGMKVTEYFLGFGPRLWSFRRGETEYGIKAIPAGGYVKIIGMSNLDEVDPADEPRTYRQAPFWRRLVVVSAGSAMHFLLAFLLLWSLLAFVGTVDGDHPKLEIGSISGLATGQSPAQKAGLQIGDKLIAVDGVHLTRWDQLPPLVRKRPGQDTVFTISRHGQVMNVHVTPVDLSKVRVVGGAAPPPTTQAEGFVGIGPALPVVRTNPAVAVPRAGKDLGVYTWQVMSALGHIFSPHGLASYGDQLTGRVPSGGGGTASTDQNNRFVSPVGLVRLASDAAQSGIRDVVILLITINVFVGVFNMVPLLPLDGGHAAIAVYEKARSRRGRRYRVDIRKMLPATYVVFFLLVALGVTSLYLDIVRPFPNPFQ